MVWRVPDNHEHQHLNPEGKANAIFEAETLAFVVGATPLIPEAVVDMTSEICGFVDNEAAQSVLISRKASSDGIRSLLEHLEEWEL